MKTFIVTILDQTVMPSVTKDVTVQADNLQITPDSTLVFINLESANPNNGNIKRVFARGYWQEARESSVSIHN